MTINTHLRDLVSGADRDGIAKLVVGAVIHQHDQVLVLRRSTRDDFLPGIEELPSGGVESGEDLLTALARELAEEVGWQTPVDIDSEFVSSFDYVSGSGRKARQFTFALTHRAAPIVLSEEHTSWRWIGFAEIDRTDLTAESKRTIREWRAHAFYTRGRCCSGLAARHGCLGLSRASGR